MPRDFKVYLDDILEASERIKSYTAHFNQAQFAEDAKTIDAVVRNLEVIGEAVKKLPENIRTAHPGIEWKKIAGLRDILIHEYFGIDTDILWDVVQNKIPVLTERIRKILK